MELLNAEMIKKALKVYEDTISPKRCAVCVMAELFKGTCEPLLFKETLALITEQELKIKELTCENMELKSQQQEALTEEEAAWLDEQAKIVNETIRQTKADTVRKMQERLKMYFGTYVLGYKIPLSEALKSVDQIAKEMLEGKDDNA